MAEDISKEKGIEPSSSAPTSGKKDTEIQKKKQKGIVSRIWNSLFRVHGDDFEKRLQHISKEEASVLARMKKRTHSWRRMTRNLIVLSEIMEVSLVCYLATKWWQRSINASAMTFNGNALVVHF